jgi:hypothetical protein
MTINSIRSAVSEGNLHLKVTNDELLKSYKQENNVNGATWSAQSPNLNTYENVMLLITKENLYRRHYCTTNR